ncbi:MAG: hypothetical protein KJZ79_20505 [Bryobacteraceae bacterium]|nr:hypothetical protein [Bryobacteraceae bacterium]
MIEIKDAIRIAKEHAADLLGEAPLSVAEFEREEYNGHPAWVITLGFSIPQSPLASAMNQFQRPALEYRRFFVDEANGKVLAMKIREFAFQ